MALVITLRNTVHGLRFTNNSQDTSFGRFDLMYSHPHITLQVM